MSKIYSIGNTEDCVALTDPASLRQIVTALKGEGYIKRNARIASFALDETTAQFYGFLHITYLGEPFVTLWPSE